MWATDEWQLVPRNATLPSGGKDATCGNLATMNDGLATPGVPTGLGELLERGLQSLRGLLGERWVVDRYNETGHELEPSSSDAGFDLVINIMDPGRTSTQVLVECRQQLSPEDAIKVLGVQRRTLRRIYNNDFAALVIAPWLSPRVREILSERDIGYIDLTGNVSLRMERPGLIIRTQGAQEDPNPTHLGVKRRLSGQKALGLIRLLVDVAPPYRAGELASLTGLSTGYVSRLLDVMQRQALIVRSGRTIVHVDWPALIRARASESVF